MGSFYLVKFIADKKQKIFVWKSKINYLLKDINNKVSMYKPRSELSLFNDAKIKQPIKISKDFHNIMQIAEQLYYLTNGAWDGTTKVLVDLWGFGTKKTHNMIPTQNQIELALLKTGFHNIDTTKDKRIYKKTKITLDLSSIAKGYAVDAIIKLFVSSGFKNLLVEIGGDIYASGKNKKDKSWSIGISIPDTLYKKQKLYKTIYLKDLAIATSGNYQNFFKTKNKIFSHIINPKTGFPIKNKIVSASVISNNCTFADGLATALMVMDLQKSIALVNSIENTECLIIEKTDQGFINHMSKNFHEFFSP